MSKTRPAQPQTFALPASLDVTALRPLLEALTARRAAPLALDGSAVERVGGLGLQLLISARETWRADHQPLTFLRPSRALEDACALAGMALPQSQERL